MPKPVSFRSQHVQPLNWFRAVISGMGGALAMMAFIDCFAAMGITPFSLELYLGSLLRAQRYGVYNWTVGVFATMALGAVFGLFYAYAFEYFFHRATGRNGVILGFVHTALAALAFFPFVQLLQNSVGTEPRPEFGFFGAGLGAATPILLAMSHLLFGACMGTFYGPARSDRVSARAWEPGHSARPNDPELITAVDDPIDAAAF